MTLVAFRTGEHDAEIVTDSLSYTVGMRRTRSEPAKAKPLPGLNAVMAGMGEGTLTAICHAWATQLVPRLTGGFDELVDVAERALPNLRAGYFEALDDAGQAPSDRWHRLFFVGYSPRSRRFIGHVFQLNDDGLSRFDEDVMIQPSPVGLRPAKNELVGLRWFLFNLRYDRIREELPEVGEKLLRDKLTAGVDRQIAEMRSWPPLEPPRSDRDWIRLAIRVRQTRSLAPIGTGLAHYIGGELIRTRLSVDGPPDVQGIHRFDDEGDEFARMVAGTLHETSQRGHCHCGSGKRYIDCHLGELSDVSCQCGSGQPFGECCSVLAEA